MKSLQTKFEKKVLLAMRDFGYEYVGNVLISKGVRGFMSDRIVGRFKDYLSAAEFLIPIICNPNYAKRVSTQNN